MSYSGYTEDTLVQQTTAKYLEGLGWQSIYAYNTEMFGPNGTLGRADEGEVVLTRDLRQALEELNPGLPAEAYENVIRDIIQVSSAQSALQTNLEKYALLREGVKVTYRGSGGDVETPDVAYI